MRAADAMTSRLSYLSGNHRCIHIQFVDCGQLHMYRSCCPPSWSDQCIFFPSNAGLAVRCGCFCSFVLIPGQVRRLLVRRAAPASGSLPAAWISARRQHITVWFQRDDIIRGSWCHHARAVSTSNCLDDVLRTQSYLEYVQVRSVHRRIPYDRRRLTKRLFRCIKMSLSRERPNLRMLNAEGTILYTKMN